MSPTIWRSREDNRTKREEKTEMQHKLYQKPAVSEELQQLNSLS